MDVAWHTGLDDVAEEANMPAAAVVVCEKSITSCSFPLLMARNAALVERFACCMIISSVVATIVQICYK